MEITFSFIPLLTIAIGIGLPVLVMIQYYNKKSTLQKIPSLKIWNIIIKSLKTPPQTKLNFLNLSFLLQILILCLLAYLCAKPFYLQESKIRPIINILINRSTSMSARSDMYSSRWERLNKNLYNQLLEVGLLPEDQVNIYFNPPLNTSQKEIALAHIDKIINETEIVDLPPSEAIFFQLVNSPFQTIYVTDSIAEIPLNLKENFSVIQVEDREHINVGWVEFWVEGQSVNGVLKNFSDYALNVNLDLKINKVSVQADDFAPAIKPNESILFTKTISEDMANVNLIEISVECPGDALASDNYVSLSRLQAQKLKILITPDVPQPIIKVIRALGNKANFTLGDLSSQVNYDQFDLVITNKYLNFIKANQLIINPTEGTSFFQILENNISGYVNTSKWLNNNEQKLAENVMFENIQEIKENVLSDKILVEIEKNWPIISRWQIEKKNIYVLNFDCSEKSTISRTPLFPFLVAKVIEEMNFNSFHYFKTGEIIEEFKVSSKTTKVFQSNRKGSAANINFNYSDFALLSNTGIFSNESTNICVNLLNANESNIKQSFHIDKSNLNFTVKDKKNPIDLMPYIAGLILLLIVFEWMFAKKENSAL